MDLIDDGVVLVVFVRESVIGVGTPSSSRSVTPNEILVALADGSWHLIEQDGHSCANQWPCATTIILDRNFAPESLARSPVLIERTLELNDLICSILACTAENQNDESVESSVEQLLEVLATSEATDPVTRPGHLIDRLKARLAVDPALRLELDSLSGEEELSVSYLSRRFRAKTGTTLRDYLKRLRINQAMMRLAEGEEDICNMALSLGFSSHSHFTEVFHRELGESPSGYRMRISRSSAIS